jgi:hypothetical protein
VTARHHHYLSQFYLRGFTRGRAKKSKLQVIDVARRKRFETIPRNVGGLRDFNRVEAEGIDPNILEKDLSRFEGEAAQALREMDGGATFEGPRRELILYLIAMIAARSPERREHVREFHERIATRMMSLALATPERWESQVCQMQEAGIEVGEDATYESMKRFNDSKAYTVSVKREYHIGIELKLVEAILPHLDGRNWLVLRTDSAVSPFISSDNPVSLVWKEPESIPPLYRHSPGFGLRETQVCFPLSQSVALVGEFADKDGDVEASEELVAAINAKTIFNTTSQLYAPKMNFKYMSGEGQIMEGRDILRAIQ